MGYNVPYDAEKYPLPPIFILNCMVPNYPPEIMGSKSDGEGYQLILYGRLSYEIQEQLTKYSNNPQNCALSPSVRLFRDFIHSDLVNSEIRNRFKCIARIMNPNHTDFGFLANRLVTRYNAKPFLARTSSTFYHEPGKYFAADIDAHVFGYPARQGLSYVKGTIQTAIYDVGFVIEGHDNDQLPEQILASCRVSKLGVDVCKPFPEKFMKKFYEEKKLKKRQKQKQKQIQTDNNNDQIDQDDDDDENVNDQQQRTSKSESNLLNGNHRNGDVASKSTTSLTTDQSNTSSQQNGDDKATKSNWGWGYFG